MVSWLIERTPDSENLPAICSGLQSYFKRASTIDQAVASNWRLRRDLERRHRARSSAVLGRYQPSLLAAH